METLKFKIGDKVRVKSLEWYNSEQKNAIGAIMKGMYCIPYNEETKHLAGTNEEAPEFYRI